MKVRIVNMPVRIDGKRYLIGQELEVDEKLYKTMKSNCIIIDDNFDKESTEDELIDEVVEVPQTKDDEIKESTEYKTTTKDDIMIGLAQKGIEFDPNKSKLDLFKMLGSD